MYFYGAFLVLTYTRKHRLVISIRFHTSSISDLSVSYRRTAYNNFMNVSGFRCIQIDQSSKLGIFKHRRFRFVLWLHAIRPKRTRVRQNRNRSYSTATSPIRGTVGDTQMMSHIRLTTMLIINKFSIGFFLLYYATIIM